MFYRTSCPSGPLPCYPSPTITNRHSRATGIADHILPLGDWLLYQFLLIKVKALLLPGFHVSIDLELSLIDFDDTKAIS